MSKTQKHGNLVPNVFDLICNVYPEVSTSEFRKDVKGYLGQVFNGKSRLILSEHGRPAVALVPISDLVALHLQEETPIEGMRNDPAVSDTLNFVKNSLDDEMPDTTLKAEFNDLVRILVRIVDDRIAKSTSKQTSEKPQADVEVNIENNESTPKNKLVHSW